MKRNTGLLFKLIRIALKRVGIDAFVRRAGYHYVPDYYGTGAPKLIDIRGLPQFGNLATKVIQQGKTLLYYDRLFTIYQSLMNIRRFDSALQGDMVEIGVYRGGSSYFIASLIKELGFQGIRLHCFDTFEGHAAIDVHDVKDPHQKQHYFGDTNLEAVQNYLSEFDFIQVYKGRFQDTCDHVQKNNFSFVHLDLDLYEPTIYALKFFDQRLFLGGIVVVDDYGFTTCPGVKQAVDEFIQKNTDYFSLHLLSGQCVLTKYK